MIYNFYVLPSVDFGFKLRLDWQCDKHHVMYFNRRISHGFEWCVWVNDVEHYKWLNIISG